MRFTIGRCRGEKKKKKLKYCTHPKSSKGWLINHEPSLLPLIPTSRKKRRRLFILNTVLEIEGLPTDIWLETNRTLKKRFCWWTYITSQDHVGRNVVLSHYATYMLHPLVPRNFDDHFRNWITQIASSLKFKIVIDLQRIVLNIMRRL